LTTSAHRTFLYIHHGRRHKNISDVVVLGKRNIVLHNLEHLKPHKITSCRPMGERRYRAVFRESGDYVSLTTNSIEGTYQNAICASVPCGRKASSAGGSIPSCWLHESHDHCFGSVGTRNLCSSDDAAGGSKQVRYDPQAADMWANPPCKHGGNGYGVHHRTWHRCGL
jgi:hypothetical protein